MHVLSGEWFRRGRVRRDRGRVGPVVRAVSLCVCIRVTRLRHQFRHRRLRVHALVFPEHDFHAHSAVREVRHD